MHNAAFSALSLPFHYELLDVSPDVLADTLSQLPERGFCGVNITHPHKEAAFHFLSARPGTHISSSARHVRAVNTLAFRADGTWDADSTDGAGFWDAAQETWGIQAKDRRIVLLGAGGAGRAVALAAAERGAGAISILSRSPEKAAGLVQLLSSFFPALNVETGDFAAADRTEQVRKADILIQATPIWKEALLPASAFRPGQFVAELMYDPPETPLMRQAAAAGACVMNGLGMLLHQGIRAFEFWRHTPAPVEVMQDALQAAWRVRVEEEEKQ